jgi:predicted nucleotidyltransferase component of viral defense system
MRIALEDRLNSFARDSGSDIMRIRRHVPFDRFLARLFYEQKEKLILKDGYALELHINNTRTTKDIDISFNGDLGGIWTNKHKSDPVALHEFIQNLALIDTGDYFEFVIGNASFDLENAPYGGYRFPVEARMAGCLFIKFEIDFAAGDAWIEPHGTVKLHDWFNFASLPAPEIPVISQEQQFAEKIHAYTLPRTTPNSRVKDIVDIILMIEKGNLKIESLNDALLRTFQKRNTHPVTDDLPDPPGLWHGHSERWPICVVLYSICLQL